VENMVRQDLSQAAKAWKRLSQGDRSLAERELWQGARLAQAIELHESGEFARLVGEIEPAEREFLHASRRRSQRLNRFARAGFPRTLVAAVFFGSWAWLLKNPRRREAATRLAWSLADSGVRQCVVGELDEGVSALNEAWSALPTPPTAV